MPNAKINRRTALASIAGAAVASTAAFRPHIPTDLFTVTVIPGERRGTIKPAIYSQFAEHIGGVIYDGIWVGPDSKVPNIGGFRKDTVEHVRRLGPVVVRWPGGCFADRYHWRDGIGPREARPRRYGRWRDDTESNQFGTHEFLHFCRVCGVEPYLAANVGTGSAEEFQSWVEYCNAPAGTTTLADERAANGDAEPFRVRYWGVGNESWGCGGKFTPEDYCREYRKFTEWVPNYGVPVYLIAAGPNGNDVDWTRRFFQKWADGARAPIHGWSPHYYCGTTGHALKFSNDQWYEMLEKANRMEKLIDDQWNAMGEFDREHRIKLIIDEWGAWHPEGTEINTRHLFEQMGCLRDALVAALTLDTFNRHAAKIDMANVAQLVNNLHSLFLADGDRFVATPSFCVFEMYRPHQNGQSVRVEVGAPELSFKAGNGHGRVFRLAGSASINDKGVTLTLVHTHTSEAADVDIDVRDVALTAARLTTLSHERLNAHNTFDEPKNVMPKSQDVTSKGPKLRVTLPPASVNRIDVRLG